MRITINTDSGAKEVDLKPKKKHRTELLLITGKIQSEGETAELAKEMLDTQDRICAEATGFTQEEFDNLDLEEQNKLTNALREILFPFSNVVKKN